MSKQFWAVLAAIVVILGVVFALSHRGSSPSGTTSSSVKPTEHIEGKGSTGVKLVEYGDYQCPYCEAYSSTVSQVVSQYSDKIYFQFRNFPLQNAHPNAFAAARAAEAAALQGKFWEMHNALYDQSNWQQWTQSSAPSELFDNYAQQLGLNVNKFNQDFASDYVNKLINADMAEGNKLGVEGTPTFFLDGKQVTIDNTVEAFQKVLDAEIAKKQPASSSSSSTQAQQ